MNFDFSETAGASASMHQQLAGNKIHEVTFDGCEARDIKGVQDPSKTFKVLDIKFSNADGSFTHTVWEPRDSDYEDTAGVYGNNPSNVKSMMLLFKHLIDAVNPELGKKIDDGEVKLTAANWDALRKLIVESTNAGVGVQTKIKLMLNNRNEPTFPGFYASYNRAGKLYMRTNFIGSNVFFTSKEEDRMKKQSEAKPTPMASKKDDEFDEEATKILEKKVDDFDLDV